MFHLVIRLCIKQAGQLRREFKKSEKTQQRSCQFV